MRILLSLLLSGVPLFAQTAPRDFVTTEPRYKIAVIDTGYDPKQATTPAKICKQGSYDFSENKAGLNGDPMGHGTTVINILAKELKDVDYCIIVLKIVNEAELRRENVTAAIRRATQQNVKAINLSLRFYDQSYDEEDALNEAVRGGAVPFVAVGNENRNLNENCNAYPACYDIHGMITVGALDASGELRASYSNYGLKVKLWYSGVYFGPHGYEEGTSLASPRALSEYVRFLSTRRK